MKRIVINRHFIFKKTQKMMGLIFSALGILSLFIPLDTYLTTVNDSLLTKLLKVLVCIISVAIFVLILASVHSILIRKRQLFHVSSNYSVNIMYSDILNVESFKRSNIIIPVNSCFDTLVDDDLISSNTLHGQLLEKIYSRGQYSQTSLNNFIQQQLKDKGIQYKQLNREEKRLGNLKDFPIGTVAEVRVEDKCYLLVALSRFDSNLHAITNDIDYLIVLNSIINILNVRSQGFSSFLPLIGTGASMVYRNENDVLKFMESFFKINQNKINCDINIVVRESARDSISIL